jgi:hypothetical protein
VEEKLSNELFGRKSHHFRPLGMTVIFPAKGNLPLTEGQQSLVGDGHAMCVPPQIFQNLARSSEGRFGIHHPLLIFQRSEITLKGVGIGQPFQVAEELKVAVGMSLEQDLQEEAAEQTAEHAYRQKKPGAAGDPPAVR